MYYEDEEYLDEGPRFTVIYDGYLFYGDSEGRNSHDYDRWEDVKELMWAYGDIITVKDNYYDVTWENGEWY